MKFLLIDDSKTVHLYIKGSLNNPNFSYDDAYNGKEGIELLKNNSYDIILLDWEMPVLNGPATLTEIRKFDSSTPIIMVTTKSMPEEIISVLEAGANEYVMKPFTKEILQEKLESVLGKKVA